MDSLLTWLATLICLIAGTLVGSPGLDAQSGYWVAPGGEVRVAWEADELTAAADEKGRLALSDASTRGQFAIVSAKTARDCVQRAALVIGTAPGVTYFDFSLADRPATDPSATSGLFQVTQGGLQQIAYVECRDLQPGDGGIFLEIRIISPADVWPESIARWSTVLAGIETDAGNLECPCDERTESVQPGMG